MTRHTLRLILVLLLALALRLIALDSRALWYDEAFAVLFSEKGVSAMLYGTLTPVNGVAADVHPVLYYGILDQWMRLVGQTPGAVRLYSVLLGVATVWVVYLVARELFDDRLALGAALVTAIAPFHVQYSQEARMYAQLGLLLMLATWCYVRAAKTHRLVYWIGVAVFAGVSMYTQQLAAFYLLALGTLPLIQRRGGAFVRMLIAGGVALLIYLPWLLNLPGQLGKLQQYWILRPDTGQLLSTLWAFVFVELEIRAPALIMLSVTALALIFVLLGQHIVTALRRKGKDQPGVIAAVWLLLIPILLMWLVSQIRPVYLIRALLPSALIFYVLLAWLFGHPRIPRPIRALVILVWLVTVGLGLYQHYTWNTFPRPPYAEANRIIAGDLRPDDRIVHANKLTMLPMTYYNRNLPHAYINDPAGSATDTLGRPTQEVLGLMGSDCPAAAANGATRVWFVIFKQQIEQQGGKSPEKLWFDAHYRGLTEIPVSDLLILLYDQPDAVAQAARCEQP